MNLLLPLFLLFSFPEIEESIPNTPFAYPGKNPREVILFDPENSPRLQAAKNQFFEKLNPSFSEAETLVALIDFIRDEMFDLTKSELKKLNSLLGDTSKQPEIPIDFFIEHRIGVCRHMALITTYFVDQLIKENLLSGDAFFIRENLPYGRHAWTLLLTETGAWHIDAYWGSLENGKTDVGFLNLCKKYGKKVMDAQKLRWTHD